MKYVLFVCTHNAGPSQMARAFFEARDPAGRPLDEVRTIRDELEKRLRGPRARQVAQNPTVT